MSSLLKWTGHPLVDVGMAAVCAMVGREDPTLLTLDDLDRAAEEMREHYFSGSMISYLTCVFMNSEYVQPGAGPKKAESRKKYAERVLYAHRWPGDGDAKGLRCAFSGDEATHLIHRGQMPLLTGEDVLNFYPAGVGALPIRGPYLTALQALPLGGRRTEGKLLVAHADEGFLTVALARRYLNDNRRLLALAKAEALPPVEGPDEKLEREQASWDTVKKRPKYPDAKSAQSLVAWDLMEVWDEKHLSAGGPVRVSVTVYWLSNSGQGPSLEIYPLPSNLLRFLVLASGAETRKGWRGLVARGWQDPGKGAKKASPVGGGPGRSRNAVLADLLAVYENGFCDLDAGRRFVRRHLLSEMQEQIRRGLDCEWSLISLFLKEVFGMEQERVDAIRSFADRLAQHIQRRNDRGLFRSLVYSKRPWEFRNALTKAQRNEFLDNRELLFGLDEYLNVFEAEDNVGKYDWSLTRDLISIRLIEQLQRSGYLSEDMLKEEESEELEVES
jgi:CRISPR-associated protein Cst1